MCSNISSSDKCDNETQNIAHVTFQNLETLEKKNNFFYFLDISYLQTT